MNELHKQRNTQEFIDSLKNTLSILGKNWSYSEAWLPNTEETKLTRSDNWYEDSKFSEIKSDEISLVNGSGSLFEAWKIKKPVTLDTLPKEYSNLGLKNGIVLPVISKNGDLISLLSFYSIESKDLGKEIEQVTPLAIGLIGSGVSSVRKAGISFQKTSGAEESQMIEVFNKINARGVFNSNSIYEEVYRFYNDLGFPKNCFANFKVDELASYIRAYIAAKKVAETLGTPEDVSVETVRGKKRLYLSPSDEERLREVEKKIEDLIKQLPEGSTYSVKSWVSIGSPVIGGKKKIVFTEFSQEEFVNKKVDEDETEIKKLVTSSFQESDVVVERYQKLLQQIKGKTTPGHLITLEKESANLTILLRTNDSYLSFFTPLAQSADPLLSLDTKFVENFSNGLTAYSFHFNFPSSSDPQSINKNLTILAVQLELLSLLPQDTPLTHLFHNASFNVEEYAYAMTVSRFIFYFLDNKNDEYQQLAKFLKNDPLNFSRLENIHRRLHSAAVSPSRIQESVVKYFGLIKELFQDFKAIRIPGQNIEGKSPKFNEELAKKISKTVSNDIDEIILGGFLRFNEYCLKTNFFNPNKSSLSFRMGGGILRKDDPTHIPFGIFWVTGSEFQGFHVRMRDISRGGIRMITSPNESIFNKNTETQFLENYGLASTQNKKNKDIPEFGSKGTILLYRGKSQDTFLPFKKYVAGLLDLICEDDSKWYNDFYGKPEVLFLGPDEGTAGYMQWAAEYSGKRGYKFWRAFTTGKPESMGGIPHDMFGMTTLSCRSNYVGCLKKSGLDEEKVTKLQTGGPRGDLGSNEILMSKDRTIGVVDGSGVIYDPEGLNREELNRLAKIRSPVIGFDPKYLSPKGFKVLTEDVNVKLPSGEIIEDGRKFRDEFHLLPCSSADFFVPCGGRPEAVNMSNVHRMFNQDGTPRFKFVIEGANLFFTQEARQVMEKAGVVLYKDASANKGGVTSSSLEVLAALSMKEEDFAKHMMVKDINNPPPFYSQYVKEIQEIVSRNADLEFECIWSEHERTGTPRFILTDIISEKINSLNDLINKSSLYENHNLKCKVLLNALPKSLVSTIGLNDILEKVPANYLRAIFCANLASTYVYKYGIDASEICSFEFFHQIFQNTN